MNFIPYHKDLKSLHVHCEAPRAYFIPYEDEGKAVLDDRMYSAYYCPLNGNWNFKFYESFEDIEDDFLKTVFTDSIQVPMNWQMAQDKGYDTPLYSNLKYPYPIDPPHVPDENPCGHYNRMFEMEEDFSEREIYLNFEGVDSCFYLWINGRFAGYSQVSHCTSEFDVTQYLKKGKNSLDVLVVKWCDGSYLEDQDCFRLSGIFREVYLLKRCKNHLRDIYIKQFVSEDLQSARICAEMALTGQTDVRYKLLSPENDVVCQGAAEADRIDLNIEQVRLWNDEAPCLYNLIVYAGDEIFSFKLALRRFENVHGVLHLNGQPVKARGINRHDSHPELGHATPEAHMLADLYLLKRNNCNTIRTSHYPNDPRFLKWCDELGFMVVDEADIETHGMGFEYGDTWDWMRWSLLSTLDEWEEAYVDRAKRLFERDKNHGCVIMWSLGNESGCGKNHRAMRNYIKMRDERAIVHYENAHLQFTAVPEGEDFSDISDVESRMYAPLDYTKAYLEAEGKKKPFFFCEYVCSMTTGDVYAHWDLVEKYDSLFGACIWELTDHAVRVKKADGSFGLRYGGDWGEYPNDTICCIDGLVYPDRTPRPGLYDMKRVYQPFKITQIQTGMISVESRRFFESLDDMSMSWILKCNNDVICSGVIDNLDLKARETKSYTLFDANGLNLYGICYLTVSMCQKQDTAWAKSGYEVGFEQFRIKTERQRLPVAAGVPAFTESRRFVAVTSGETCYTFDKSYGRICSIVSAGKERLCAPVSVELWKAHPYNQQGLAQQRKISSMHKIVQKTYSCTISAEKDKLKITCAISLSGTNVVPLLKGTLQYTFYGDGSVTVRFTGDKRPNTPQLPRFGFKVPMTEGHEYMQFFGYGPHEAYADRYKSCKADVYSKTVTDNFEHYIRPFENSAHYGSKYGVVTDEDGRGLFFAPEETEDFLFNATHFTPQILEETLHDDELVPLKETVVNLDCKMDIAGGKGYYETVEPCRSWDDSHIDFSVRIKPFDFGCHDSFDMLNEVTE